MDRASILAKDGPQRPFTAIASEVPGIAKPDYCWFALFILTLIYVLNVTDRWIVTILLQPMKEELRLPDWQLGLLNGLAFAALSSTLGLKIARHAERANRVRILGLSLLSWSVMTVLCGRATNFLQMLLFRMGVGAGEAGCMPTSHSLIADYFPPDRRTTAYALYGLGLPIGGMLGMISGGVITDHWGWRSAFIAAGLPGILLGVGLRFLLREPPRGEQDTTRPSASAEVPPLRAVLALLWRCRTTRHTIIALTLSVLIANAASCFFPAFLVRRFELPYSFVAILTALTNFVPAAIGVLVFGLAADRLGNRDRRWYMWVPMVAVLLAIPFHLIAYRQAQWLPMIAFLIVPGFCAAAYMAPSFATLQNIATSRMRATVTAVAAICTGLIGMGIGPLLGGMTIDTLAGHLFATGGMGDFALTCPGGAPPPNASAAVALSCRETLASATQLALLLWAPLMIWPAVHYYIASRSIRRDLGY